MAFSVDGLPTTCVHSNLLFTRTRLVRVPSLPPTGTVLVTFVSFDLGEVKGNMAANKLIIW